MVILLFISLFPFYRDRLNESLNSVVAGDVDRSCVVDTDCVFKPVDCSCGCGNAVNKDWNRFCAFSFSGRHTCEQCLNSRDVIVRCNKKNVCEYLLWKI